MKITIIVERDGQRPLKYKTRLGIKEALNYFRTLFSGDKVYAIDTEGMTHA